METQQPQQHEMVLETVHPSGVEEWFCPTCGRRFLMQWPPEYKKVVLEAGDEFAIHSGSKGGHLGQYMDAIPVEQEELVSLDHPSMTPWLDWMEKVNFESLWEQNS